METRHDDDTPEGVLDFWFGAPPLQQRGELHVRLPEHQGARWYELNPGDGFYIPQGEPHQYYNVSDTPVSLIFGVAPAYASGER